MKPTREEYQQQIQIAKETVGKLEDDLHIVRNKLQKEPLNAEYLKHLKQITLDMTITLNELEHSQSFLSQSETDDFGFSADPTPAF